MESNGKGVNMEGKTLPYETAVVNFGEPGTNGQHSFYQLLHQGRTIPSEFIGFTKSQQPLNLKDEISNHDELMSNFFSQPDALALGKSIDELKQENVDDSLLGHKFFSGNRPSTSILFLGRLNPYHCGQLLALYEHRTSVEGYLWDIDSYDQWGVQLGKVLATRVRSIFQSIDYKSVISSSSINSATKHLLELYMSNK
jgi:glucose-6-phosphate isomerase